ncbi:MAG: Ig-like domain-containing protein [Bacteroidota bacterium]
MRKLIKIVFISSIIIVLVKGCANPVSPTGGPKDTIPPTLLSSTPFVGQTSFKDQTITLEFSEFIDASKLQQNLVITPRTDIRYKHVVKRTQLIITFDEELNDSTTYNLNFREGITDITERNPAENLNVAFSTGDQIDSMKVFGRITDLLTGKNQKDFLVGLYDYTDTLDLLLDKPSYFTKTLEDGTYNIGYIKDAAYKLLAFNDENGNFTLDPETEDHGFLDSVYIFQDDSTLVSTIVQNVRPLKQINTRPDGEKILINYNKPIIRYKVLKPSLSSMIAGAESKSIRLYKSEAVNYSDSLEVIVSATDTTKVTVTDTVKIAFLESSKKLAALTSEIQIEPVKSYDSVKVKISFNKPTMLTDTAGIYFYLDSVRQFQPKIQFTANYSKTKCFLTLYPTKKQLSLFDSLRADTTTAYSETYFPLQLIADSSSFISIENDTVKRKAVPVEFLKEGEFGKINMTLLTDKKNFIFQLINAQGTPVQSIRNRKLFQLSRIKAGAYSFRVILDTNNNAKWDPGNLLEDIEPEEVILLPEKSSVRANWEIDLSFDF